LTIPSGLAPSQSYTGWTKTHYISIGNCYLYYLRLFSSNACLECISSQICFQSNCRNNRHWLLLSDSLACLMRIVVWLVGWFERNILFYANFRLWNFCMIPFICLTILHSIGALEISAITSVGFSAFELGLWEHMSSEGYYSLSSFFLCLLLMI
jgi:hypothetical protein